MEIREYQSRDCEEIIQLFINTVKAINRLDYTEEQINAWLDNHRSLKQWDEMFLVHHTYVALIDNCIVGFADIDDTGYFDHLFIHKDYQHQGIASALCDQIEKLQLATIIKTDASITAKPFFEKRGYTVLKEQQVLCNGVKLTNYSMQKKREPSN